MTDGDDLPIWVHFRGAGPRWVYHAATAYRGDRAEAPRWAPLCGEVESRGVHIDGQGDVWCAACLERMGHTPAER